MAQVQKPIITEKTVALAQNLNKYTFQVSLDANKTAAAKEIEQMFNVTVESVSSNTRLGKEYGYGKYRQQRAYKPAKKVMVFTLKAGDKIEYFDTQA